MIYTMTLSPALDYIITIEDFSKDAVNRNEKEEVFAGGKGINVSQVLKNLEIENVALGFVQDQLCDQCMISHVISA